MKKLTEEQINAVFNKLNEGRKRIHIIQYLKVWSHMPRTYIPAPYEEVVELLKEIGDDEKFIVGTIQGLSHLCCTEHQNRLLNRGYYWAVMRQNIFNVVSLHLTKEAATKACNKRNKISGS